MCAMASSVGIVSIGKLRRYNPSLVRNCGFRHKHEKGMETTGLALGPSVFRKVSSGIAVEMLYVCF